MTSASARDVARAEDFEKDPAVVVTSAAGAGVYVVGALEGDGLNTLIGTLTGDGDDAAVVDDVVPVALVVVVVVVVVVASPPADADVDVVLVVVDDVDVDAVLPFDCTETEFELHPGSAATSLAHHVVPRAHDRLSEAMISSMSKGTSPWPAPHDVSLLTFPGVPQPPCIQNGNAKLAVSSVSPPGATAVTSFHPPLNAR